MDNRKLNSKYIKYDTKNLVTLWAIPVKDKEESGTWIQLELGGDFSKEKDVPINSSELLPS